MIEGTSEQHALRNELDLQAMISARARSIDASGIRRVFELGSRLEDPVNLSIGQPDFPVPDAIKRATADAIAADRNGYTLTQGAPELLDSVRRRLQADVGWSFEEQGLIITSGTSGALLLAFLALLDPGDEVIVGDPFFVIYPALAEISGASCVLCDTYPDFRLTAARAEPLITSRTKALLVNSPGNPSGVVLSQSELSDLVDLCAARGILLISDEIYDEFTYAESRENGACPSPARLSDDVLLVRGFGKTYGCTGWRMGYAAGRPALIEQMTKLQQYTFVCAPAMAQVGLAGAFDVDMRGHVATYQARRDRVVEALSSVTSVTFPGGAFYAFVEIPERLGLTGTAFAEEAIDRNLLVIPGKVFSQRDTHVRLSFAVADDRLGEGLAILREMLA